MGRTVLTAGARGPAELSYLNVYGPSFLTGVIETAELVGTALSGTVNVNIKTNTLYYSTANQAANWTFNFRADASESLNSYLLTGRACTVSYMVTNAGTAYYPTAFTIDGSAPTIEYQGGLNITGGNTNSVDIYTMTMIKRASATWTMFVSQTRYA